MQITGLPIVHRLTARQQFLSVLWIATATLLLTIHGVRIVLTADLWHWWVPCALIAGMTAADFASGLVHWGADTWGRDDLPLIGERLLVPFRVHHVNPDDLLRRSFIDANGEVAAIALPVLGVLSAVPIESAWGAPIAVFGVGLCGLGVLTNQIHQWAHMPSPPRAVRLLQDCRVILGRTGHSAHHERPYDGHYCITTGWCNAPLEAIGFFRRLDGLVTKITGALPRDDDRRHEEYTRRAPAGTH
jgi:ubiquitin-conjugating enzyme E2 variant